MKAVSKICYLLLVGVFVGSGIGFSQEAGELSHEEAFVLVFTEHEKENPGEAIDGFYLIERLWVLMHWEARKEVFQNIVDTSPEGFFPLYSALDFETTWEALKYFNNLKFYRSFTLAVPEPFDKRTLDNLETALHDPAAEGEVEDRIGIAALLYRYGREFGEAYLREKAGESLEAAYILVRNGERIPAEEAKALLTSDEAGRRHYLALGRGDREMAGEVLAAVGRHGVERFRGTVSRFGPLQYALLVYDGEFDPELLLWTLELLATHRRGRNVGPPLRSLAVLTQHEPDAEKRAGYVSLLAGVLTGDKDLDPPLRSTPGWLGHRYAALVREEGLRETLRAYIEERRDDRRYLRFRDHTYTLVLVSLLSMGQEEDVQLMRELLEAYQESAFSREIYPRFRPDHPEFSFQGMEERMDHMVKMFLLNLYTDGVAEVREVVREVLGEELHQHLETLAGLKRLPPEYAPVWSEEYERPMIP